jgi:hypothetical protein
VYVDLKQSEGVISMHALIWLFLIGFAIVAMFYIMAYTGIAFIKALFLVLLFPVKLALIAIGAVLWLVFMPLKILLVLILGVIGIVAIPVVASVLCLFGLLVLAC